MDRNCKRRKTNRQTLDWFTHARATTSSPYFQHGTITKFTNCRVLYQGLIEWKDLWVSEGNIIDPKKRFWDAVARTEVECDYVVDCRGLLLAPGFIDIQINGSFGVDFSRTSLTRTEVLEVAKQLPRYGCTSFVATLVTSSPETYRAALPQLAPVAYCPYKTYNMYSKDIDDPTKTEKSDQIKEPFAAVLGAHLEGPFLSKRKKGAHDEQYIHDEVSLEKLNDVYGPDLRAPNVRLVTLAPELPGALEAIKELVARNIVVSMGHTKATIREAEAGFEAGSSILTHLFNAMGSFHHRDPGVIGLLGRSKGGIRAARGTSFGDLDTNATDWQLDLSAKRVSSVLHSHSRPVWGAHDNCSTHDALNSQKVTENTFTDHSQSQLSDLEHVNQSRQLHWPKLHRPYFGLIADGVHSHPYSTQIAHSVHPQGLVLVTDGIAALGLPIGKHILGSMEVEVREADPVDDSISHNEEEGYPERHAVLAGTKTLAGAIASIDACVRNLRRFTQCNAAEALECASLHPARLLGIDDVIGTFEIGSRADIVLLDDEFQVQATYISGVPAYYKDQS